MADLRTDLHSLAMADEIDTLKRQDQEWRENILEYMQSGKVLPVNVQAWARQKPEYDV
jgi:hypothetical protein